MEKLKVHSEEKTPLYKLQNKKQVFRVRQKLVNDFGNTVMYEFYVIEDAV